VGAQHYQDTVMTLREGARVWVAQDEDNAVDGSAHPRCSEERPPSLGNAGWLPQQQNVALHASRMVLGKRRAYGSGSLGHLYIDVFGDIHYSQADEEEVAHKEADLKMMQELIEKDVIRSSAVKRLSDLIASFKRNDDPGQVLSRSHLRTPKRHHQRRRWDMP